jgi:nicotinamidase-related amidase
MSSSENALLVIDMQQGLFRARFTASADTILSNICLLIEKARQAQVPSFCPSHRT